MTDLDELSQPEFPHDRLDAFALGPQPCTVSYCSRVCLTSPRPTGAPVPYLPHQPSYRKRLKAAILRIDRVDAQIDELLLISGEHDDRDNSPEPSGWPPRRSFVLDVR